MPSGESDPNWKSNYGTETKKEAPKTTAKAATGDSDDLDSFLNDLDI